MVAPTLSGRLIRERNEITGEWLSALLGTPGPHADEVKSIGTGAMSLTLRVRYSGTQQGSVIVKLASEEESVRKLGLNMGAYVREVDFYQKVRDRIVGPLPNFYFAELDPDEGWFTVVMEDIVGSWTKDQMEGVGAHQAEEVVRMLAQIHAPVWNDDSIGGAAPFAGNEEKRLGTALFSSIISRFFEIYKDRIPQEYAEIIRGFAAAADQFNADRRAPFGIVHGDARLDNILFRADDGPMLVDWQTVQWGPVMTDVAFFLGSSLTVEDRREYEELLVRAYHDELRANGVMDFSWETAWEEYRRQVFAGIAMVLSASVFVDGTERTKEMFLNWMLRACQQALDLDSLALLPEPQKLEPLRVDPADEGCHPASEAPLWSESYYLDAVSDDGTLGIYARIGDTRNLDSSLVSFAIVRPGRGPIILSDAAAPLAAWAYTGVALSVKAPSYTLDFTITEPVDQFVVTFDGQALVYADDTAILRGEAGTPVTVSVKLHWDRDGIDYRWRQTTRYEIPCRVTGTITIDGEEIAFVGDGQRDHSWGIRDWWGNVWMWTAFRLDDGEKIHAVTVEEAPGMAFGYAQRDDSITELFSGTSLVEVGETGKLARVAVTLNEAQLNFEAEPIAYGSLLLIADDGREAHFIRALSRFRAGDGRNGIGWIEWEDLSRIRQA